MDADQAIDDDEKHRPRRCPGSHPCSRVSLAIVGVAAHASPQRCQHPYSRANAHLNNRALFVKVV